MLLGPPSRDLESCLSNLLQEADGSRDVLDHALIPRLVHIRVPIKTNARTCQAFLLSGGTCCFHHLCQ